jgi:hypothetical protein
MKKLLHLGQLVLHKPLSSTQHAPMGSTSTVRGASSASIGQHVL